MNTKTANLLLSVVIPVYAQKFDFESLFTRLKNNGLLNQFCEIWLIVNGVSRTEYLKIKSIYATKRVKFDFINESSVAKARNRGLSNSTGTFVVFLDADDELYLTPDFVKKLEENIFSNYSCLIGDYEIETISKKIIKISPPLSENTLKPLIFKNQFCLHSIILRTEIIKWLGIEFEDIKTEDWLFWISFFRFLPKIKKLKFCVGRYHERENSLSKTTDKFFLRGTECLEKAFFIIPCKNKKFVVESYSLNSLWNYLDADRWHREDLKSIAKINLPGVGNISSVFGFWLVACFLINRIKNSDFSVVRSFLSQSINKNKPIKLKNLASVSIIIPTVGNARNIERLVSSIKSAFLSTTFYNLQSVEVVIVDNSLANNFKNEFNKMRFRETPDLKIIFIKETKKGLRNARHAGMIAANSEVVAFLDDDMEVNSNWFEIFKPILSEKADVVVGRTLATPDKFFNDFGSLGPEKFTHNRLLFGHLNFGVFSGSIKYWQCIGGNFATTKSKIESVGGFPEDMEDNQSIQKIGSGETGLNLMLNQIGCRFFYCPRSTAFHHISSQKLNVEWLSKRKLYNQISLERLHQEIKILNKYFVNRNKRFLLSLPFLKSFLGGG